MPTQSAEEKRWHAQIQNAFAIAQELLGNHIRWNTTGSLLAHPVWHVGYNPAFDLNSILHVLAAKMEAIDCQVVAAGVPSREIAGEEPTLYFTLAPLYVEHFSTVYHATPSCRIPSIFQQGLLPSNEDRSLTKFVNTFGRIHASKLLKKVAELGDPATWWQNHLAVKYEEHFEILELDLSDLPTSARLYRDPHSMWGFIIDRLDRIPPNKLRLVKPDELISTVT